jgi:hypothetical protein
MLSDTSSLADVGAPFASKKELEAVVAKVAIATLSLCLLTTAVLYVSSGRGFQQKDTLVKLRRFVSFGDRTRRGKALPVGLLQPGRTVLSQLARYGMAGLVWMQDGRTAAYARRSEGSRVDEIAFITRRRF